MWARDFGLSFHVVSILEVTFDSFAVEFWGWVVLYLIVLSSMMLFKCSFRSTRNLLILYVHEHDRLGFAIDLIPVATDKVSLIQSHILFGIGGRVLCGQDP